MDFSGGDSVAIRSRWMIWGIHVLVWLLAGQRDVLILGQQMCLRGGWPDKLDLRASHFIPTHALVQLLTRWCCGLELLWAWIRTIIEWDFFFTSAWICGIADWMEGCMLILCLQILIGHGSRQLEDFWAALCTYLYGGWLRVSGFAWPEEMPASTSTYKNVGLMSAWVRHGSVLMEFPWRWSRR